MAEARRRWSDPAEHGIASPELRLAVETGAPVRLYGRAYVPADDHPAAPGADAVRWQAALDQPAEVVVVLSGRVAYRVVGAEPFPILQGLHRRFVRAALEHALERLEASDA